MHAADAGNGLHGQCLDDYGKVDGAVAVESRAEQVAGESVQRIRYNIEGDPYRADLLVGPLNVHCNFQQHLEEKGKGPKAASLSVSVMRAVSRICESDLS